MFTVNNNRIFLTRGDTAELSLSLVDGNGNVYEPTEGDTIYFRLKKYATSTASEVLISKTADLNLMTISFEPTDTIALSFGDYRYEVELVTSGGSHYTVIADSAFEIGKELENHE